MILPFLALMTTQGPITPPPIVPGPDDRPAFPAPPAGFDARRESVPHGRMEEVAYASKSVGATRRMMVYTPPGYSAKGSYPVLYLLHGIGGTEREWQEHGAPREILDNLLADGKIARMIVVFPNGRARKDDRPGPNVYADAPAFAEFDRDLLGSVIPFVESRYPVARDRDHRALAGLSMGGGQALNVGLAHPETFAWVGAFSPAPNQRPPEELANEAKDLRLLWLSCGDRDGLVFLSQRLHAALKARGVPHVYHIEPGPHDFTVWRADLYRFAPLLFRP